MPCGLARLRAPLHQAATVMLNGIAGPNWLKAWAQAFSHDNVSNPHDGCQCHEL